MKCPNCNNNNPDGSRFCNHCGYRIEESSGMVLCSHPHCGKEIPSDSKFCPFCGTKVSSTSAENSVQDKLTFEVNGVSFNMIRVEGGTFTMGATPEQEDTIVNVKPAHRVTLSSSYYIGETQVTQALWKTVMGSNPSYFEGDNLPVESVSWDDCQNFIRMLNKKTGKAFRLPTEAEWEFAARGGRKSRHTKYSGNDNIDEVAWYDKNSNCKSHPVRTKKANELGLYDMTGNVCERCQDWYEDYNNNTQTDPTGPKSGAYRVCRGGAWSLPASWCCVYSRYSGAPDYANTLGLRLVLSE